jgi:hypothetical protein
MKRTKGKLSLVIAATAVLLAGAVFSCKKSSSPSLPKIGPYDNSNQVASASLLAHWTFDGTNNETISSTAPSNSVGAAFATGVKGQALVLTNGYLAYPAIAKLNTANAVASFTVSAWVNVDNNGSTVSEVFALTQASATQSDWNTGSISMYLETGHPKATDDTLVFHGAFSSYTGTGGTRLGGDNINDYGVRGTDFQTVKSTNKWVHYVLRYDASGSNIDIFANGVRVSNNNFRNRTTGNPPVGIGAIVQTVPTQVLIGGIPNATTGFPNSAAQVWQGLFTGSIDELRVYNSALQDTDIGYLYQLELAGR